MFAGEREFGFLPTEVQALSVWTARLGAARLCRVESTGHRIRLDERAHHTVLIPRTGTLEVEIGGRLLRARPGETLVLPPNARATQVIPNARGRYRADCVLLPAEREPDAGPSRARPLRYPAEGRAFLNDLAERPDGSLRAYCDFLFNDAERPGSSLAETRAALAAEALLSEILLRLLLLGDGRGLAEASGLRGDERAVRRAEEIMEAELAEPLTIRSLADTLGLSPRRLQQAFQTVRGRTPREVLSEMRLEAARQRLLAPAEGDTVSAIALDCGFAHFGRFARAYGRRFGERPSETLRRA
jgi:AraC-like DNA-binding protein